MGIEICVDDVSVNSESGLSFGTANEMPAERKILNTYLALKASEGWRVAGVTKEGEEIYRFFLERTV